MLKCNFPLLGTPHQGKVRDMFDLVPYMLMVATDRISAFDVILPNGIPRKGEVLTQLSALWLKQLAGVMPNQLVSCDPREYPKICRPYRQELDGRSMLVHKAIPFEVECVVRGYLAGSSWKSYQNDKTICGIQLPPWLKESDKLPEPIFTPATKAPGGAHDENINFERMIRIVGWRNATLLKLASLVLYDRAQRLAEPAGIIIADTKFEFGLGPDGEIILIDEVLTPDSSRFWPADQYRPGGPQSSFDKQFVRDYLEEVGWNKRPPAPKLPERVVRKTSEKYLEAYERLAKVLAYHQEE